MPVKNISLMAPTEYTAEAEAIARKRKLAEALQAQSMQPIERFSSGGIEAPISWTQGLAKMLQAYSANKGQEAATAEQKALAARFRSEGQADVGKFMGALQGTPASSENIVDEQANGGMGAPATINAPAVPGDRQKALAIALQSQNPMVQGAGSSLLSQLLKGDEPYSLAPGAKRMQGSKEIAYNPKQEGFSLSSGAVRYGPDGKIIATGPADPNKPFQPGGIPNSAYQQYELSKAAAGASRVSVDNRAEGAYAQKVGGGAADRDEGQVKSAQAAVDNLQKLDSVIKHLKTSNAITGLGSDVLRNVERAKVLFTQSKAAGKVVSDTELLDTMLGSDVFPMIQALGIGARGMDTPAEREFLRNVMTGTTALNKDTLIRMTELRRDISKRAIDRYNKRVEGGELDQYFRFSGMPKQKIEIPDAVDPDEPPAGAVRPRR